MFCLAPQTRKYQVAFILQLVHAYVSRKFWEPNSVCIVHKGKTGQSNMAEHARLIFEEGKVYTLGDKKVTAGEIIAKAEAYDAKHSKAKCAVVIEARHRIFAVWLVMEFFGIEIVPEVNEVGDEMAKRVAVEINWTNEQFARQLNTEKLSNIVEGVRTKLYTRQEDLPGKHGRKQYYWWLAQAVINQGVSLDDAVKMPSYKEAKAVSEGGMTLEAATTKKGNESKVLPGGKQREMLTVCKNYDPELKQTMGRFVKAIVENAETEARQAIIDFYKGTLAVAPKA